MSQISGIITNYNTATLVDRCLSNIKKADNNIQIIFVNNSPQDGSSKIVAEKYPEIKLIELDNPGLSVAYNTAAKYATGELLLFLGTDAFPTKEVLEAMADYFNKNTKVGILTTKLVLENGKVDFDSHRGFPTMYSSLFKFAGLHKLFPKSNFFNHYFLGGSLENKEPHEIDSTISHFMMVRKEAFDKVGGFDEDYFLYGEDIDFCYRVKEAGYKIVYLPQYSVLHLKGASVGVRKHNKSQIKRSFSYRKQQAIRSTNAMRLFVKKHYAQKYSFLSLHIMYTGMFLLEKLRIFIEWLSR